MNTKTGWVREGLMRSGVLALIVLAGITLLPSRVQAVPSFARQTGMSCTACHTEFPILTEYGRQFKLNGYTMSNGLSQIPPVAVMVQPSFSFTNKGQPGGAAPHFGENSNFAVSQTSLFYAGRLFGPYAESLFGATAANVLNKFGVFGQMTFDGVGRVLSWDNLELRYADNATIGDHQITYGFFVNNNPGMEDPWNSTPVWGFPFSSSPLGPTPGAATLIDGGLAQQVAGAGAYVLLSNSVYLELAGYHTLSVPFQRAVGVAPEGETQVSGLAPYWRLAYTKAVGNQSFEIGTFGLAADSHPGRNQSAGHDSTLDWGLDAQYQVAEGPHDLIATASSIYEHNSYFFADGKDDPALYPDNVRGNPLSDGVVLQLNYLPFNKNGGPSFWPKSNLKLSAQYIIYNRFNGAAHNIDGAGRNASDNNTLYLEAWLAF